MTNATKQTAKNVPEMRFSGFEGAWEEKRLGEVVENIGGTALESYVDLNGTHNFISIGNYSTDGKYIDNGQRISLNDKTKAKLLNKNDLVMVLNDKTASGDLIGSTILIEENDKYIYNQRSERLIAKENISSQYLWAFLNSEKFRNRIITISQGGTQIYVNFPSVKKEKINLPQLPEQQKIASFLGAVDEWVQNLRAQKENLEQYKKAIMQQIFSQKIRFRDKNGNNFPDWEEKKIGEMFEIKAGGDVRKLNFSKVKNQKHPHPVYANALRGKGLYGYSDKPKITKDSVTVTARGDIGHAIARKGGYSPVVRLLSLIPKTESSNYFFECAINRIRIFVESTGVPQLTAPQISSYKIRFPSLPEQQKIASLLTSLDNLIQSKQTQITQAENWKKGLMQKLFV